MNLTFREKSFSKSSGMWDTFQRSKACIAVDAYFWEAKFIASRQLVQGYTGKTWEGRDSEIDYGT